MSTVPAGKKRIPQLGDMNRFSLAGAFGQIARHATRDQARSGISTAEKELLFGDGEACEAGCE